MKTRSWNSIWFTFVIFALIVFNPELVQAAQVAKFTCVEGNVDLTAPGKAAKRVFAGDAVQVGDILRTKSKSKCEVTFIDGNVLRLAENTRLRVTEYMLEQNQRKEILNLDRGKIRNIVLKAGHSAAGFSRNLKYEVHTPTAVCGVRGTDFVSYHQDGITGVTFKEGSGYGYSNNRPQQIQSISANQTMLASSPDHPPVVRPATTTELGQHLKDTEPGKKSEKEEGGKEGNGEKKDGSVTAGKEDNSNGGGKDQGKEENKNEDGKASGGNDSSKGDQGKSTNEGGEGNKTSEDAPKVVEASKTADENEQSKAVDIVAKSESESSSGTPTDSTSGTSSSSDSSSGTGSASTPTEGAAGTATSGSSGSPSSSSSGTGADTAAGGNSGSTSPTSASGSTFDPGASVATTLATSSGLPTATTPANTLTSTPEVGSGLTSNPVADIATLVEIPADTPPEVTIITEPPVVTNSASANFTFHANEPSIYSYAIDGGEWKTISEPSVAISDLEEKQHAIEVVAIDNAGNKSTSKSYSWKTDYTAPTVTIVGNPSSLTNASTATFMVQSNESIKSYSYSTDGTAWTSSSIPTVNFHVPEEGDHTFYIKGTDEAGNTSSVVSYTWKTDYTAPTLTILGNPSSLTNASAAAFTVQSNELTKSYSYSTNGVNWTEQIDTTVNIPDLSQGSHTFYIKGTDEAGNTSSIQSYTWVTDYTAPVVSILPESAVPVGTNRTHFKVNLSGTDASPVQYSYRIYEKGSTAPENYTSANPSFEFDLPGNASSSFTLDIKSTDGAGNESISSQSFDLSRYAVAGNVGLTGFSTSSSGTISSGEVAGISGRNWGSWIVDYEGAGIPGTSWRINAGNVSETDHTYWLSSAAGTVNGTDLSGTSFFQYLAVDKMGIGKGTMSGSFNTTDGIWQARNQGIGQYSEVPAAFTSSILHGEVRGITNFTSGSYYYNSPDLNTVPGGSYSYLRLADNSKGYSSYYRYDKTGSFIDRWKDYAADGTIVGYDYITDTPISGNWKSDSTFDLAFLADPPREVVDGASVIELEHYSGVSLSDYSGEFSGMFAGPAGLWTATESSPASVMMMGQFGGKDAVPSLWSGSMYSNNFQDNTTMTKDGGAYYALTGGTSYHGEMAGMLIGLYINPSGGAGYLSGSLQGSTYPSIGMFGLKGSVFPIPVVDSIGIKAADLAAHVWSSDDFANSNGYYYYEGYGNNGSILSGAFNNGGTLKVADNYSHFYTYYDGLYYYDSPYQRGNTVTAALIDSTGFNTLSWGVFGQQLAGITTDNSGATWTGRIGGQAIFGAHSLNQAFQGEYSYPDGGSYYYQFNTSTRTGYAYYDRADQNQSYNVTYYSDGQYSRSDNGVNSSGRWTGTLDFLAIPPDSNAAKIYSDTGIPDGGFWLASFSDGALADGKLTGKMSGRFLSSTLLGSINGKLQGIQDVDGKSFVAINGGTWQGEPLKFFSPMYANGFNAVPIHSGYYSYSDGSYYDYGYSSLSREGHTCYFQSGKTTNVYYYPDGKTYTYTSDSSSTSSIVVGTWDPNDLSLSSLASNPNEAGTLYSSIEDSYDYSNPSSGNFYLGGKKSLWYETDGTTISATKSGIPVTLLGILSPYYNKDLAKQSVWLGNGSIGSLVFSCNSQTDTDITYENGAYAGYLGGIRNNDQMEGRLAALYIDPLGNAGYLKGSMGGASGVGKYYDDIAMVEMDGSLDRTQVKAAPEVNMAPEDLFIKISSNSFSDLKLGVRFNNDLKIETSGYGSTAHLTGQEWGIYGFNVYGGYDASTEGVTSWSGRVGGGNLIGSSSGYWLAAIDDGTWLNKRLQGTLSGRYLTSTSLKDISGDLLGTYNDSYGTWQAVSIGTYGNAQPLTFSSMLNNGSVISLTKGAIREVDYEKRQDVTEDFVRYSYGYFSGDLVNGKKGAQFESLENSGSSDAEYEYFPTGRYVKWGGGQGVRSITDAGTTSASLNLGAEPPVGNLSYYLSYFTPGSYKVTDTSWISGGSVRTGSMTGIMGGSGNLWTASQSTPADIVLMGDYQTEVPTIEHNLPTGFGFNTYSTTIDGGAYNGFLTGRIGSSRSLEGFLYGLYITPDSSSAGVLRGAFAGSAYPGISMWEADGTITPIWKTNGTKENIQAACFLDASNMSQYSIFLDKAAGVFADSSLPSGSFSSGYGYGGTVSIRGEDWGIYQLSFALDNKYANPDSLSAWRCGLSGNGGFGKFLNTNNTWSPDIGLWLASIPSSASTWSDGRVSAIMDGVYGKFLTYTKRGVLQEGQLLGSYIPDSVGSTGGIWSAISMGMWEKTADLSYSSAVSGTGYYLRHIKEGRYEYSDGSAYNYTYNDDHPVNGAQRFGHSYYENKSNGTIEQKDYFKGSVDVWTKQGTGSYSYNNGGTYPETEAGLSATLDNVPADLNGMIQTFTRVGREFTFDYDNVTGIMGGLDSNLWTANGSNMTFLGQFDAETSPAAPSIFSGNFISFNPKITMDPNIDTTSPLGGAYFGAFGGSVYNNGTTDSAWKKSLNGSIYALYVDPNNNAGILKGSLTGSAYPQIDAWEAEGTWKPIQMASNTQIASTIDPSRFHDGDYGVIRTFEDQRSYYDADMPTVTTTAGGQIKLGSMTTRGAWIDNPALLDSSAGPTWGVVQNIMGGSYGYTVDGQEALLTTPLGNFDISFDGQKIQAGQSLFPKETSYLSYVQDLASFTADKGGYFKGTAVGSQINVAEGRTSVMALDVHGTFDPVKTSTWQAISTGAWLETGKFIDMAASGETARAALNALNIPCVQVGTVNLTGQNANSSVTVNMNDVNFYARSTGAAPQIWATKNVNGTYTATPTLNAPITLNSTSGGNITASFTPVRWDNGKWGATVNTIGNSNSLSGGSYAGSVQFKGGAAGSYTGTGTGSFSGTGAGTAKKP